MFKPVLLAIAVVCCIILLIVNHHDKRCLTSIIVVGMITFAIVGQQNASDQSLFLLYALAIIATILTMCRQHRDRK